MTEIVKETKTVFVDKDGIQYDARGNPMPTVQYKDLSNEIAFYTDKGQILHYSEIYPGPVNIHQNQALTDLSVSYELDSGMFVGPKLAPIRTVPHRSDIYYIWAPDDVVRNYAQGTTRPIGAEANEIQQGFSTSTYTSVWYSVKDFLPDKQVSNADQALQLTTTITEFLTQVIELDYDRRIVNNMLTATGSFSHNTMTAIGGGKIGAATPTTPYFTTAVNAAKNVVRQANNGKNPNTITMSASTALALAASYEIRGLAKYRIGPELVSQGGFTDATSGGNYGLPNELLGLKVVVLPHVNNSAAKGQTGVFTDLLTDDIGIWIVESPALKTRNTVTTFRIGGLVVKTYRDEKREGNYVEVQLDQTENLTNANGGYIITGCVN